MPRLLAPLSLLPEESLPMLPSSLEPKASPMSLTSTLNSSKKRKSIPSLSMDPKVLSSSTQQDKPSKNIKKFTSGAEVYAKKVHDPERFGVVEFDQVHRVVSIKEKPLKPKSNYIVVGIYTYDNRVVKYAKELKPSKRGEIEITDLNNIYLKNKELKVNIITGFWEDAGTFDSLLRVSNIMAKKFLKEQK